MAVPKIDFTRNFFDFFQDAGERPRLIDTDINARKRLVLLVRDPRDVAVSYSHHDHDQEKVFTGSLDDFVRSDIYRTERQSRFVLMMLDMFDRHGGPKHFLPMRTFTATRERRFATAWTSYSSRTWMRRLTPARSRNRDSTTCGGTRWRRRSRRSRGV